MAVFLLLELLNEVQVFLCARVGRFQFWKFEKLGRLIGESHISLFLPPDR